VRPSARLEGVGGYLNCRNRDPSPATGPRPASNSKTVIASGAKQSTLSLLGTMDCYALASPLPLAGGRIASIDAIRWGSSPRGSVTSGGTPTRPSPQAGGSAALSWMQIDPGSSALNPATCAQISDSLRLNFCMRVIGSVSSSSSGSRRPTTLTRPRRCCAPPARSSPAPASHPPSGRGRDGRRNNRPGSARRIPRWWRCRRSAPVRRGCVRWRP